MPRPSTRSLASRLPRRVSRRAVLQGSLGAAGVALVGCSAPGVGQDGGAGDPFDLVARPAEDIWPQIFRDAPPTVQENYRFAVANEDLLKWMPCFCGCVDMDHANNFDCYVQEVRPDGSVLLDAMSFA